MVAHLGRLCRWMTKDVRAKLIASHPPFSSLLDGNAATRRHRAHALCHGGNKLRLDANGSRQCRSPYLIDCFLDGVHIMESIALLEYESITALPSQAGARIISPMLDTVAERINYALQQSGVTKADIARACDVTPQAVTGWTKTGRISKEAMYIVAEKTGFNAEWLATGRGPERKLDENVQPTIFPAFRYPIVSWVAAGMWEEAIDLYAPGVAEDWIFSTYKGSPNTFALRVKGDSMVNPVGSVSFPEGIIIVIDPNIAAENGSYVVARLNGSMEATFKQLVIDGNQQYLKPLNPRYPLIPISEECQICGVVKAAEMRF